MRKLLFVIILSICIPFSLLAQSRVIKGNVVDDNGKPAESVNVVVKGDKKEATQTDKNGNFSISVAGQGKVTLVFSSTQFNTKTITTDGTEELAVKLQTQVTSGDEVVVIGYQSIKAKDLTGAVTTLAAKQIKDIPVNSTAEALTGRLAGVQITTDEGAPGADASILVRGGGSITQDNSPLYIIDGVEIDDGLSQIAPEDIENITVLKDASATAIYGARGANGVIIVTTKGGKNTKGRTVVTYNGFVGFRQLPKELQVMDPQDFVEAQYEFDNFSSDSSSYRSTYDPQNLGWSKAQSYADSTPVDWQHKVFGGNNFQQTHNLSISGGTDATKYNLSLTDNQDQGLQLSSEFDRKIVNFRFDHVANKKFKMGFNARYNEQVVDGPGTSDQGSSAANSLRQVIMYHPLLTPAQVQNPANIDQSGNSLFLVNPVLLIGNQYKNNPTSIINMNGYLNYSFNNYFSFKTTLGYNVTNATQNSYNDSLTYTSIYNGAQFPVAEIDNVITKILNNSNVFTYSNAKATNRFKDHNDLDVIVGEETYQKQQNELDIVEKYFPNFTPASRALNNLGIANPALAPVQPTSEPTPVTNGNPFDEPINQLSFFSRINYTYNKKYLATFTFRADGTSIFSQSNPNNVWGYFPAASVAWKISDENFMKNVKSVSDLKLRLSYGTSGNNRIAPFSYSNNFGVTAPNANPSTSGLSPVGYGFNNQFVPGYAPVALGNPALTWETTVSKNIGVDAGLFNHKLELTADVYKNDTKNLLVNIALPSYSGYNYQYQNVGATTNTGVELQLNAPIIQNRNFSWTASFNISFNNNKVTQLGNGIDSLFYYSGWESSAPDFKVQVGQSLGLIYGLVNDGFYTTNDFNITPAPAGSPLPYQYTLKQGIPTSTITTGPPMPGTPKYKDINGDGVTSVNDETVIGNARPKFFGGLNQQFSYKSFDMSIFINFQYGNQVLNANKIQYTNAYTEDANMLAIMNNRFKTVDGNGNQVLINSVNSSSTAVNGTNNGVVLGIDPTALNAINKNANIWTPSTSYTYYVPQSFAVEDGSFIRINNITLGYTIPKKLIRSLKISSLRAYVTVNNLAVISGYSGYDPEVNTRHSTPLTPGVDYSAYPRSRIILFGINLSL